jgi:hypothetical protein
MARRVTTREEDPGSSPRLHPRPCLPHLSSPDGTVRLTGLVCSVAWCGGQIGFVDVTSSSLYKGHRYPVEIISHCVWLYHRFPLSLREVEEMMLARGVLVTYESIHQWCRKFGQAFANGLRRRRARPGIGGSGAGAMTTHWR